MRGTRENVRAHRCQAREIGDSGPVGGFMCAHETLFLKPLMDSVFHVCEMVLVAFALTVQ